MMFIFSNRNDQNLNNMIYEKYLEALDEARSHPYLNPKTTTLDELKKINYHQNKNDDVFVTMTFVDKFGMNPSSKYDTPLGIYCYPLKYVIEKKIKDLPFVKDAPFLQVFKASNITLIKDLAKYKDKVFAAVDEYYKLKPGETEENIIRTATCPHSHTNCTPYKVVWYTMYKMIRKIEGERSKTQGMAARKILLKAGITSLYDKDGESVIHPNEPTQAFFLDKTKLTLITRLENDSVRKGESHERFFDKLWSKSLSGDIPDSIRSNIEKVLSSYTKLNLSALDQELIKKAIKSGDPNLSFEAMKVLQAPESTLEANIAKDGNAALKYMAYFRGKINVERTKVMENAIFRDCSPREVTNYLVNTGLGLGSYSRKVPPNAEQKIAKDQVASLDYAISTGKRFRMGEPAIFGQEYKIDANPNTEPGEYRKDIIYKNRFNDSKMDYFKKHIPKAEVPKMLKAYPKFAEYVASSAKRYMNFKVDYMFVTLPELDVWLSKRTDFENKTAFNNEVSRLMPYVLNAVPVDIVQGSSYLILLNLYGIVPKIKFYLGFMKELSKEKGEDLILRMKQISTNAKEVIEYWEKKL